MPCQAITAKGTRCNISTKGDCCHVHQRARDITAAKQRDREQKKNLGSLNKKIQLQRDIIAKMTVEGDLARSALEEMERKEARAAARCADLERQLLEISAERDTMRVDLEQFRFVQQFEHIYGQLKSITGQTDLLAIQPHLMGRVPRTRSAIFAMFDGYPPDAFHQMRLRRNEIVHAMQN